MGPICGRPLGLGYDHSSNQLYIADAYFGLLAVGSNGGPATQAATSAEGVPFRFLSGLDVDPVTGTVYITDFSTEYELRYFADRFSSVHSSCMKKTRNKNILQFFLQGYKAGTCIWQCHSSERHNWKVIKI